MYPKYYDIIQQIPETFNASQKIKQETYKQEFGENKLNTILWSDHHHDLKSHKTVNYAISNEEYETLKANGIFIKTPSTPTSFPQVYAELHNNDIPVMVTADSMLFALHTYYDLALKKVETTKLLPQLTNICKLLLDELHKITPTEQNKQLLMQLEVFLVVPNVLINLNKDLDGNFVDTSTTLYPIEELKQMLEEPRKGRYSNFDTTKLRPFLKFIDVPYHPHKSHTPFGTHEKLREALNKFVVPHISKPNEFKFGGEALFYETINKCMTNNVIEFNIGGVVIQIMGNMLNPQGHYTESINLKQYYMAFSWLSKFTISTESSKMNDIALSIFKLQCLMAKLAEPHLNIINEYQQTIKLIRGEPVSFTVESYLELINEHIPKFETLNETFIWILNSEQHFTEQCNKNTVNLNNLSQYHNGRIPFNFFGDCHQIDNIVISKFTDDQLILDNSFPSTRKIPSIYDILYTLFNNESAKSEITYLMNNVKQEYRDGYSYNNHLEVQKQICENLIFDDTIYSQELKMIRSLVSDNEMLSKLNIYPFNTINWNKKQATTQMAHYAEIRHDNNLYINACWGRQCCQHPDILIELVPTFWKEMLVLVNLMKKLNGDNNRLKSFSEILNVFIEYSESYLEHKPISDEMLHKLKSIIVEHTDSGGDKYYGGWYSDLLGEVETEVNPIISTYFSSSNDNRGPGMNVQLGTGPCKLLYVLTNDHVTNEEKILIGPIYSAYEILTDSDTSIDDDIWKATYNNYTPF